MRVKAGISSDMLRLATKFRPNVSAFEIAVRAGFHHAELWTDAALLLDWQQIAQLAQQYSLDYALHFPNRLDQPIEVLTGAVELYRALNASALVLHQEHFTRYGKTLRYLHPEIRLAVENHRIPSVSHWADLNPGLALDVEHLWMFGNQHLMLDNFLSIVRDLLHSYSFKLYHVHLPGYLPGYPEHRTMYCSRDLVYGVFDLLREIAYQGLVVSEANEEFQNGYDLRMDVLLFQKWIERCK